MMGLLQIPQEHLTILRHPELAIVFSQIQL